MSALDDIIDDAPDDGEGSQTYERNQEAAAELTALRTGQAMLVALRDAIGAVVAAQDEMSNWFTKRGEHAQRQFDHAKDEQRDAVAALEKVRAQLDANALSLAAASPVPSDGDGR